MASKFRQRTLDANKRMPILRDGDISDELITHMHQMQEHLQPPVLLAGMEKEEEQETHLQRALDAQQVMRASPASVAAIPVPKIIENDEEYAQVYQKCVREPFRPPVKSYINNQVAILEEESDGLDVEIDSEDESWLKENSVRARVHGKTLVSSAQFEVTLQRFEQASSESKICTQDTARALAKDMDEETLVSLYKHWSAKRATLGHALLLYVKSEKNDGSSNTSSYIAFRKRSEKMQTRKNRKNDEHSYMRMLKLRRDMGRVLDLIQLCLHRERLKSESVAQQKLIVRRRYLLEDFDGRHIREAEAFVESGVLPSLPSRTVEARVEEERKEDGPVALPAVAVSAGAQAGKQRNRANAAVASAKASAAVASASARTSIEVTHTPEAKVRGAGRHKASPLAIPTASPAPRYVRHGKPGKFSTPSPLAEPVVDKRKGHARGVGKAAVVRVGTIVNNAVSARPPAVTPLLARENASTVPIPSAPPLAKSEALDLSQVTPPSISNRRRNIPQNPDGNFAFNPLPGAVYLPPLLNGFGNYEEADSSTLESNRSRFFDTLPYSRKPTISLCPQIPRCLLEINQNLSKGSTRKASECLGLSASQSIGESRVFSHLLSSTPALSTNSCTQALPSIRASSTESGVTFLYPQASITPSILPLSAIQSAIIPQCDDAGRVKQSRKNVPIGFGFSGLRIGREGRLFLNHARGSHNTSIAIFQHPSLLPRPVLQNDSNLSAFRNKLEQRRARVQLSTLLRQLRASLNAHTLPTTRTNTFHGQSLTSRHAHTQAAANTNTSSQGSLVSLTPLLYPYSSNVNYSHANLKIASSSSHTPALAVPNSSTANLAIHNSSQPPSLDTARQQQVQLFTDSFREEIESGFGTLFAEDSIEPLRKLPCIKISTDFDNTASRLFGIDQRRSDRVYCSSNPLSNSWISFPSLKSIKSQYTSIAHKLSDPAAIRFRQYLPRSSVLVAGSTSVPTSIPSVLVSETNLSPCLVHQRPIDFLSDALELYKLEPNHEAILDAIANSSLSTPAASFSRSVPVSSTLPAISSQSELASRPWDPFTDGQPEVEAPNPAHEQTSLTPCSKNDLKRLDSAISMRSSFSIFSNSLVSGNELSRERQLSKSLPVPGSTSPAAVLSCSIGRQSSAELIFPSDISTASKNLQLQMSASLNGVAKTLLNGPGPATTLPTPSSSSAEHSPIADSCSSCALDESEPFTVNDASEFMDVQHSGPISDTVAESEKTKADAQNEKIMSFLLA